MNRVKNTTDTQPLYEKSQINPGCVTIKTGKNVYHFDLMKIKEFKFENGYLYLDLSNEPMPINKKTSQCLYAALMDLHDGKLL